MNKIANKANGHNQQTNKPNGKMASTCASALPLMTTDRYHRAGKQSISVPCPSIVKKYYQYMGGVDLLDGFIS